MLVEVLRCDQLQNGVAKVLEPLVVARRKMGALVGEGAVGHRLQKEARVTEVDPDLLLKKVQGLAQRYGLRLCYEAAFSWMYSHA
jgi:hypothetical protein